MLQLTSRKFLRELDEAPGGNNLQYILKCPCIPFFGNQGLHNEIMLGGNGGRSRVMCEGSSYNVILVALGLQRLPLLSRALLEGKSVRNLIRGTWASVYEIYIAVVRAITLLLK